MYCPPAATTTVAAEAEDQLIRKSDHTCASCSRCRRKHECAAHARGAKRRERPHAHGRLAKPQRRTALYCVVRASVKYPPPPRCPGRACPVRVSADGVRVRTCVRVRARTKERREARGAEAQRGGGRNDFTRVRPSKAPRAHPAIGGAALLRRGRRGARCAYVLWRRRDERLCSRWPMQSISGRTHFNCTISVKTKCKVI